ncbi:MAG: putrescine ABC transporter permease PotI, partial [Aeromonas veronii]
AVRLGVKPEINAVASLILLSVSLFTFGSWYLMARAEKRRRAEIAMTTQMQAVV